MINGIDCYLSVDTVVLGLQESWPLFVLFLGYSEATELGKDSGGKMTESSDRSRLTLD